MIIMIVHLIVKNLPAKLREVFLYIYLRCLELSGSFMSR